MNWIAIKVGQMDNQISVCWVVALQDEARPIIEHFKLKHVGSDSGFSIYAQKKRSMWLIVSGIGKVLSGAATAFLSQYANIPRNSVWLNIGICGHPDLAVGTIILGTKVVDMGANRSWFPPVLKKPFWASCTVHTHEQADLEYAESVCSEMEAAGFLRIATRLSSQELVQVIKVVSDNRESSIKQIDRSLIRTCIQGTVEHLGIFVASLCDLAEVASLGGRTPTYWAAICEQWRFSETQRHQLRRELVRWEALLGDLNPLETDLADSTHAKGFLNSIRERLELAHHGWEDS